MKERTKQRKETSNNALARKLLLMIFWGATLLLLFPQIAFSLGVAPSFYNLNSDAGIHSLRLRVLNSYGEDMYVQLEPRGDLAKYVDYDSTLVHLLPSEESKTLYYSLTIPDDLPPGPNILQMAVIQSPGDASSTQRTSVDARISVIQKITVFVPYPGSYLTGTLFVGEANTNEPISFSSHLISKGDEEVSVSGTVRIRGPTNEILGTVNIPETTISPKTDKRLTVSFPGLSHAGYYQAESIIRYNGEEITLQKGFSVGSKNVNVKNLVVDRFRLGEIVKLQANLENEWNSKIDDLYMSVKLLNEQGTIVSEFTSSPTSIAAYESKTLDAFWDTKNIPPGNYDAAVDLFFDDKVVETFFKTAVGIDTVSFRNKGLTGNVLDDGTDAKAGISTLNLVVFLVIILLIINIFMLKRFGVLNKKKK